MKTIILLVIGIFAALLFETAYAAAPVMVPEKYNFNKDLKQAKGITESRIATWDIIDHQSMLIKTDANNYYLVVLGRRAENLPFEHHAGVKVNIDKVAPGSDELIVNDALSSRVYNIYKIYSLRNFEQATQIKERIMKG